MTIGAAASKSTPLTIDAVEYYNRIIGFPAADFTAPTGWPIAFNRSANPDIPAEEMATGEQFVDYSGFTYNRAQTFNGSVTWLDVPTLTWIVDNRSWSRAVHESVVRQPEHRHSTRDPWIRAAGR